MMNIFRLYCLKIDVSSFPYENELVLFQAIFFCYLVGGFNPSEKYDRQIGSFPQVGMKIKNIWNHQQVMYRISLT